MKQIGVFAALWLALIIGIYCALHAQDVAMTISVQSPDGNPVAVTYQPPSLHMWTECRPPPGALFPVGSTYVTCIVRSEPGTLEIVVVPPKP